MTSWEVVMDGHLVPAISNSKIRYQAAFQN